MTQQTSLDAKAKHTRFIHKYIRFDAPSDMPCLLVSWHDSLDDSISQVLKQGLRVQSTNKPVEGMEIIGKTARTLIRDKGLLHGYKHSMNMLYGCIKLYDQFSIIETDDKDDADAFIDTLLDIITSKDIQVTLTETSANTRRILLENRLGYRLYCVTAINPIFDLHNENKCDLFIHWQLEYDQSARKSSSSPENSNIPNSAEVVG